MPGFGEDVGEDERADWGDLWKGQGTVRDSGNLKGNGMKNKFI